MFIIEVSVGRMMGKYVFRTDARSGSRSHDLLMSSQQISLPYPKELGDNGFGNQETAENLEIYMSFTSREACIGKYCARRLSTQTEGIVFPIRTDLG